ncbi:MAG: uroporphyrinogen decarboxylase family protein [Phycisphaerae bacterium]
MTQREQILSCLNRQDESVPYWLMGFFNRKTAERLMPGLIYPSYYFIPDDGPYGFAPMDDRERDAIIAFNRRANKCSIGVGYGANSNFGHGGPGEFNSQVVDCGENYFKVAYETGAVHYYQRTPHNYHIVDLPIKSLEDMDKLTLPNPNDPKRYAGFARDVAYFKATGGFTHGHINGFFSGLHYFLMDYPEVLMGFHLDPAGQKRLMALLGNWNLAAVRNMLDAGVDCITLCDDLGTGERLLISPTVFREFIKPWYIKLNQLVHAYPNRFTHLHSHGNINEIFPDLVEAGFDMINPLDPCDQMNIEKLKKDFGHRITLVGGMDKFFFDWDQEKQTDYLQHLVLNARKGGGFILMESGGIPDNLSFEQWNAFQKMINEIDCFG